MGGAVSAGRDNDELIDNLKGGKYIRTLHVERVFRALDRADYMLPYSRDSAYKDLAWKDGPLHLSAPCIYSEVMEGLDLRRGLSFLNVGSGTGYLSTMAGLILGSGGINHGIEINRSVIEYANERYQEFLTESCAVDEFDFCEPKFILGNGLCLAPLQAQYDRVYCGAGCPEEYANYFKQLIKVGGTLVMPLMDSLLQVRRVTWSSWATRTLLSVSFAQLKVPTKEERENLIKLEEIHPPTLQVLCRAAIRDAMRRAVLAAQPQLAPAPRRTPPRPPAGPRRICIPIEDDSDLENLNALHDLDRTNGGNEMNALLNLVLSMGQHRVAGSLLYDRQSTGPSSSSSSSSSAAASTCFADTSGDSDADFDEPLTPPDDDKERRPPRPDPDRRHRRADTPDTVRESNDEPTTSKPTEPEVEKSEPSPTERLDREQKPRPSRSSGEDNDKSMEWDKMTEQRDRSNNGNKSKPTVDDVKDAVVGQARSSGSRHATTDKSKRQKFDSGIGEENSPENSSSIEKTDVRSDEESDGSRSDCSRDIEDCDWNDRGSESARVRARTGRGDGPAVKRSRCLMRERFSDSESEEAEPRRRCRIRKRLSTSEAERQTSAEERRRADLSQHMKRAADELPLPPPLRHYVNLGRDFSTPNCHTPDDAFVAE